MKAHYINAKERKTAAQIAYELNRKHEDDVARRAQYLWMISMLWAGLSPKTVLRVATKLNDVTEWYKEKCADGVGDFALVYELEQKGIDVGMTQNEK